MKKIFLFFLSIFLTVSILSHAKTTITNNTKIANNTSNTVITKSTKKYKKSKIKKIKNNILIIYSTKWCVPCKKLKKILNNNNIKYIDVDIENNKNKIPSNIKNRLKAIPLVQYPNGYIDNGEKIFTNYK